ncbi:major facilitator superfamily domain-containing protein [Powellomyces hirtus]|nr:major facilitator superfamily domain-containing protein [Powellomyces hirtus]
MKTMTTTGKSTCKVVDVDALERDDVDFDAACAASIASVVVPAPMVPLDQKFDSTNSQVTIVSDVDDGTALHLQPPPDGGYGWVCVLASFLVHVVTVGVQAEYGVFQQAYKQTPEFGNVSNLGIAFVGSVNAAMLGLGSIPSGRMADRYGYRLMLVIGGMIQMAGLLLASLAQTYWQLLLCNGFITGLGICIAYFPALSIIAQWFEKKRGVAIGIAVSGSGLGGLALAPLTRAMISSLGWRWALRITAFMAGLVILFAAAIMRVRYRAPKKLAGGASSVVRDPLFWRLYGLGLFCSMGYYVPFFFMPAFAANNGLSASTGALLIGLLNGASAVGRLAMGFSADILGPTNTLVACITISTMSVLAFWPFATTFPAMLAFVLLYGLAIGGFISLLPSVIAGFYIKTGHLATITGMIYSSMFVGNLSGTPIAGAMMDHFSTRDAAGNLDVNFIPVIYFTGGLAVIGTFFAISIRYTRPGGWRTRI